MKNRNTHWLVRTILCTMFILTIFSFAPNIAHAKAAITCYKDGCDYTDPVVTGCGTSPSTITTLSSLSVKVGSITYATAEVRLSHARPYGCNTIWVRINTNQQAQVSAHLYSFRLDSYNDIVILGSQYTSGWSNQFGRDGTFYISVCVDGLVCNYSNNF